MIRIISIILAILGGLLTLADFFLNLPYLDAIGAILADWVTILAALAIFLGLWNICQVHGRKIWRRQRGWGYSLSLLVTIGVVLTLGLRPGSLGPGDPAISWLFHYVYMPLNATIFSLLAFFVASAAYRTLRLRSPESAALLLAATIVLLGQIPLGYQLWPYLPFLKDWLLQVLGTAGLRGIILGVALGTIATGLRLLLGQDRPYLGGHK